MWSIIKLIFYIGIIFIIWMVVRTFSTDKNVISNSISQMGENMAETTNNIVNLGIEKIQKMQQNLVMSVQEEANEIMK